MFRTQPLSEVIGSTLGGDDYEPQGFQAGTVEGEMSSTSLQQLGERSGGSAAKEPSFESVSSEEAESGEDDDLNVTSKSASAGNLNTI